jgi:hypothetical protein
MVRRRQEIVGHIKERILTCKRENEMNREKFGLTHFRGEKACACLKEMRWREPGNGEHG